MILVCGVCDFSNFLTWQNTDTTEEHHATMR